MRPQKQLCRPGYWNVTNVKEDIHALSIYGLRLWRGPVLIRAEHTPCVTLRVHSSSIFGLAFPLRTRCFVVCPWVSVGDVARG
jgi:hypothetical protein